MIQRTEEEIRGLDDGNLEKAWTYWQQKAREARRMTNANDQEGREILRNINWIDTEVERRGLSFDE